jgi:hypothetical protein
MFIFAKALMNEDANLINLKDKKQKATTIVVAFLAINRFI